MFRSVIYIIALLILLSATSFAEGSLGVILSPDEIPADEEFTVTVSASAMQHGLERAIILEFPEQCKLLAAYASDEDGSDTVSIDYYPSLSAQFTAEKNHIVAAYGDHTGIFSTQNGAVVYVFRFRAPAKASIQVFRACLLERADNSEVQSRSNPKDKKKKQKKAQMSKEWRVVDPELGDVFSFQSSDAHRFSRTVHVLSGWNKTSRALVFEGKERADAILRSDSNATPSIFPDAFSLSFWLKTTRPMQRIMQWAGSSPESCCWIGTNGYGQLIFTSVCQPSQSDTVLTTTLIVADGSWHHIMLTRDMFGRMISCIDGHGYDTLLSTGNLRLNGMVTFGEKHKSVSFCIDELAVSSIPLPTGRFPTIGVRDTVSGLTALFHFEDFGHTAYSSTAYREHKVDDSLAAWKHSSLYLELDSEVKIMETSSPVEADAAVLSAEQTTATKVTFSWYATSELGIKRYILQRRIGSYGEYEKTLEIKAKQPISTVDATHGILAHTNYSAVETLPQLSHDIELWYRLALVGSNDSILGYTQPVKLDFGGNRDVFVDQNKPNPFNPNSTITFRLTRKANVNIQVFDIMGREVTTLIDKKMEAGKHSIEVNASQWPGGIYFYKVKTDRTIVTMRMVVAK